MPRRGILTWAAAGDLMLANCSILVILLDHVPDDRPGYQITGANSTTTVAIRRLED